MAYPTADQPYDPSRPPPAAPPNQWDANQRPDGQQTQWPTPYDPNAAGRNVAAAEDNRPDIEPEKLAEDLSHKWSAGGAVESIGDPDVRRDPPYQALVRAGKINEKRKAFRSEGLPRELTEPEQTALQEDYDRLKPEAELAYKKVFNSQTKPEYMDAMAELVMAGLGGGGAAPDPTVAQVSNGSSVAVVDAADAPLGTATANVANSTITNVKMNA